MFIKFGSVHGDKLFYTFIGNAFKAMYPTLPNRGLVKGLHREWWRMVKNRFENGRRSSAAVRSAPSLVPCPGPCHLSHSCVPLAQTMYANVSVQQVDLTAEAQALIDAGLHMPVMQGPQPAPMPTAAGVEPPPEEEEEVDDPPVLSDESSSDESDVDEEEVVTPPPPQPRPAAATAAPRAARATPAKRRAVESPATAAAPRQAARGPPCTPTGRAPAGARPRSPVADSLCEIYDLGDLGDTLDGILSLKIPAFQEDKKYTTAKDLFDLSASLAGIKLLFIPANFFDKVPEGVKGYTAKIIGAKRSDKNNNPALKLQFFDSVVDFYLYPHPKAQRGHVHRHLSSSDVMVIA